MLSYIYQAWNDGDPVTEAQVKAVRDRLAFDPDSLAASQDEGNVAQGTAIGTVRLNDNPVVRELRNPTFSIVSGADEDGFGIGSSSGQITLSSDKEFDHESKNKYTINIRVTGGSMSADGQFVLTIDEVLSPGGISADDSELPEALRADSKSGTIPVQLLDQPSGSQNVTVSVTSATPADLTVAPAHLVFTPTNWSMAQTVTVGLTDTIVSAKGTNKNIDVVFSVHDAGSSAGNYQGADAATVSVSISIVNVTPMFVADSLEATIEENAEGATTPVGTVVGTLRATDANNDVVTYRNRGRADGEDFDVDATTGVISLKDETNFDYDSDKKTYTLRVRAEDGSTGRNGRFVLRVTEKTANAGISADDSGLGQLTPDSKTGTVPVQLLSQPDGGQNVTVTVTSAVPADLAVLPAHLVFTPDNWGTAQDLTVSITGDARKRAGNITVNLAVHDAGSSAANYQSVPSVPVPVAVNIPNIAPSFATVQRSQSVNEPVGIETTSAGDSFGTPITATDEDKTDAVDLTYSVNPASDVFGIVPGTGQLTLKVDTAFNHEIRAFYTVTVEVDDGEHASVLGRATVTVAIEIADVDEPPVFAASSVTVSIEGATNSSPPTLATYKIGTVAAVDPDVDAVVTYSLSGTDASLFAIDADGVIMPAAATRFVHPETYMLTVEATSAGKSDTIVVIISVAPPRGPFFFASSFTASLPENSVAGAQVVRVLALDLVNEQDGYPFYAITGTDAQLFEINYQSKNRIGVISVKSGTTPDFDYESAKKSYRFEVTATDIDGNVDRAEVVVNLIDLPVFAGDATVVGSLDENLGKAETVVGTPVVDATVFADGATSYVLEPAVAEFEVDASGQIKVKTATNFNYEVQDLYTVTVKASDGMSPPESSRQEVVITIENLPENPTQYSNASLSVSAAATEITLTWNNADYHDQFAPADRASIVVSYGSGATFRGTVTAAIDQAQSTVTMTGLSASTTYTLTLRWYSADSSYGASTETLVQATEAATAQGLRFVSILMADLNENTGHGTYYLEGDVTGLIVIEAAGGSGEITYSVLAGADGDLFRQPVNHSGGGREILLKEPHHFDFEIKNRYTINVRISDGTDSVNGEFVLNIVDVDESGLPTTPEFASGQATLTVFIPEVFGAGMASAGRPLVTATLTHGIPDIVWSLEGSSQDLALVGIAATNLTLPSQNLQVEVRRAGLITLKADAVMDYEVSPEFMTITVVATTDSGADRQPLVIRLSDIEPETPDYSFVSAEYENDGAVAVFKFDGSGCVNFATYGVEILGISDLRSDGSSEIVTSGFSCFTAFSVPQTTNIPAGVHISKGGNADSHAMTVRITISSFPDFEGRPLTVRVHNNAKTNPPTSAGVYVQGVLAPPSNAGISADGSGLAQLTPDSKTGTVPVQLLSQPDGSQNVTVTVTSAVPADLAVLPAHLVFTPGNWETAQDLTVSLTEAARKRAGDITVNLTVHEAGSSAANYRNVPSVPVPVAVNIPNIAPEFDGDQRSRSMPEPVGIETTSAGVLTVLAPITATDRDKTDAVDLTYSVNPASDVFGIVPGTGQLTLKVDTAFNHEIRAFYTVTVEVDDGEHASVRGRATVTVAIEIADVNEPPTFGDAAIIRSLAENAGTAEATVGTPVGAPVVATDEDAGDGEAEVDYVLEPAVDEFEIDDAGQIKVKAATNFNHEVKGSYTVTVKASDNENAESLPKEVVISITNINEAPVMPEIANQGPYGASGDSMARTFTVGPADDVDVPADTITYAASIKGSPGLPAGVSFNTASAEFTLAAGARAAGEHVIEVTPTGTNAVLLPGTATGDPAEFTLSIVEYIAGATTTIEVAEATGHNATRAGGVSIGVVELSRAISGVSWSLRGTSNRLAVSRSTTSADTEAVFSTAGASSIDHPFDYETNTNPNKLFARVTLVAAAGEIEYAQVVDVVLTNVVEDLVLDPVSAQSAVAGVGGTITLAAATNPAGVAVTYSVVQADDDSALPDPGWLSFDAASRELVVAPSASSGDSLMVKYRVEETGNSANSAEQTFLVNVVAPSTGGIVLATVGLTPLTRVDGKPSESTTTEISVHLSSAPDSSNVTLTLVNGSGLISFSPDMLVFTPSNHSSPQPVTVSVLMTTTFGSSDQLVTVSVHNAASSDQNYIFATAETFKVDRDYVNRLPVLDEAVPRLIVLAKPSSATVVLTMTAIDADGDGISYSMTNAEAGSYDLFDSGSMRARFANQRLTILPGIAGGQYELRMSMAEDHGQSNIPFVPATLVVGELSFDSGGHAISANAASFTFSYAPCGDLIVDVGYGSQTTRYRVAEAACRAAAGAGVAAGKLSLQPDGFVASFTGGYDPAPTVNFSTSGKVVVALAAFALDAASQSYSVSLAFVRSVSGTDGAHGRATSGVQGSYANYRTPVFERADAATETVPERNTIAAGHVFLTLTLSSQAAVPTWSGGSTDGALEIVASGTSPATEALLRLKSGETVNFDHESLSAGSISISIQATVVNGSGANAKTVSRSFALVAGHRNDETPVLVDLDNQGPYAAVGDSSVQTFTIPAATDRDRDESTTFSYQVSLVTGSSTVALPDWIDFDQGTRQFEIAASGRVAGDHVIEVKVSDGGTNPGPLVSVPQDFTLSITGGTTATAGIVINTVGLSALTPRSRNMTGTISVQLQAAPASANVTLTITSGNPDHVGVDPATIVFTPANWSDPQELVFELSDAGVAGRGDAHGCDCNSGA